MRSTLLVPIVCVLLVAPPAAQQPQPEGQKAGSGSIAGRVVAAATGTPLGGATLRLVSMEVMRVAKSAVTDAQGRFEFTGLLAGRYRLEAVADHYLRVEYGQDRPPAPGKPIDLREGERFDRADFALRRPGAIEGRLTDEFSDPAPNVVVQVCRAEFAAGRLRLMPVGGRGKRTDDRGQFRVAGLGPGRYYVMALTGAFAGLNESGGFAPTFYPGTTDAGNARPVQVAFGETSTISMALTPARMVRVSGTLVGADGKPLGGASIMLTASDHQGTVAPVMAPGGNARDGTFTFRNVPSGSYTLQAFGPPVPGGSPGGFRQATFGWLPLVVTGEDITGLVVKAGPGVVARGKIVFEGEGAPLPRPDQVMVSPRPVEFDSAPIVGGGPPPHSMREDWTFEVLNMSGLRVVRVSIDPPEWSLKSITLDGKDVTDTPIDFRTRDVDGLQIVLTANGASISGAVSDADGHAVSDYTVVIFAEDSSRWRFPSRFLALGRPSQDGRFKVRGLPPERYLAIALPSIIGSEWQDPDFLESIVRDATRVTLSEGEARSLDLKLTPRK